MTSDFREMAQDPELVEALAEKSKIRGPDAWSTDLIKTWAILMVKSTKGLPFIGSVKADSQVSYGVHVGVALALRHPKFGQALDGAIRRYVDAQDGDGGPFGSEIDRQTDGIAALGTAIQGRAS